MVTIEIYCILTGLDYKDFGKRLTLVFEQESQHKETLAIAERDLPAQSFLSVTFRHQ